MRVGVPKDLGGIAHLLFEWPMRQAPRLSLPLCILMAAVVQGAMMVFFSISYRAPSVPPPAAPQVYFLPADSPSARQLAPWLEANDPAAFSPQSAARAALPPPPPLNYRPSYEEPPPPLRPLPEEPVDVPEPPALPVAEDTGRTGLGMATAAPPAPPPPGTVVRWQDGLAARTPVSGSTPAPTAPPAGSARQPSQYQVALGSGGIPTGCVLLDSSGDPACDETGRIWIQAQRFNPAADTSWGRVIILWGDRPVSSGQP